MQANSLNQAAKKIADRIKATPLEEISFSEEGIATFADFAWDLGRWVSETRRQLGWQTHILEELLGKVKEGLPGRCPISISDLFGFCDFYLGCSRVSKVIWRRCWGKNRTRVSTCL